LLEENKHLSLSIRKVKTVSKQALLIAALSGSVILTALLLYFIPQNSTQGKATLLVENVTNLSNQDQSNIVLPARLKIPTIQVDAAIIPVGLTYDGAMDVPKNAEEVAWYSIGPRPGEIGSAVIAGHYNWINNMPAVFDDLHKINKDDEISIEDENGVITTFVVRKIQTYDKDEDSSDIFTSDDGKAHLNLITCTGAWNKAEQAYSKRLIVFTDKK